MLGNYSATVTVHMYRDTSMKGESKAVIWVITMAGSSHQDTVFTQSHPSDKPHNYNLFPEKVKFEALLSSRMSDRQIHAMTQAVLPPISDCIIGLQLMKSSDLFFIWKLDKSQPTAGPRLNMSLADNKLHL